MYAFTIALYVAGIKHVDLHLNMMSQPPWDSKMELSPGKPYQILHYTYGCDYTLDGKFTPGAARGGKPVGCTRPVLTRTSLRTCAHQTGWGLRIVRGIGPHGRAPLLAA